jgi:hypothetical protein
MNHYLLLIVLFLLCAFAFVFIQRWTFNVGRSMFALLLAFCLPAFAQTTLPAGLTIISTNPISPGDPLYTDITFTNANNVPVDAYLFDASTTNKLIATTNQIRLAPIGQPLPPQRKNLIARPVDHKTIPPNTHGILPARTLSHGAILYLAGGELQTSLPGAVPITSYPVDATPTQ